MAAGKPKPKWKPDAAVAVAKQQIELLEQYWNRLADRLSPDTKETLRANIETVEGKRADRAAIDSAKRAATADQNQAARLALEETFDRVVGAALVEFVNEPDVSVD